MDISSLSFSSTELSIGTTGSPKFSWKVYDLRIAIIHTLFIKLLMG